MTIPLIITHALGLAETLKYPLIMVGAFAEGPVVMIATGFLLKHALLRLFPLFISLVVGDLVGDILWYSIGRYGAEPLIRKKGTWLGFTVEGFENIKARFLANHTNILLISKITLGFGLAKGVLMAAGASKVPFKKFILLNLIGEIILVTTLLLIGYFFGNTYSLVSEKYRVVFLVVIISIIILGLIFLTKKMKQRFLAS